MVWKKLNYTKLWTVGGLILVLPISNNQFKDILVYIWNFTFHTDPIPNNVFVCDFPTT